MDEILDKLWCSERLFLDNEYELVGDEYLLAIILSCNRWNLERFISLNEFKQILLNFNIRADIYGIQQAQLGVINAIKYSKISVIKLLLAIKKLNDNNIIDNTNFNILYNFLRQFRQENVVTNERCSFFHQTKDRLNLLYETLLQNLADTQFSTKLRLSKQKIDNLSFNIVVTGVINAGKSSFLNALLGRKILGSSNVPETTNLSILKYSKDSFAVVNFWDKEELKQLGIMTDETFYNDKKQILLQDLKNYTSASSLLSKFVKNIEIYEDLDILGDGICIIDTPGIDDSVFLRERLVVDFMSECDLVVHLMNVSQSVTQKDMSFLLDCIKGSHIVFLAVVLTHIDLLDKGDLAQVLAYTENNIKECLGGLGVEICFFVVSSKRFFDGESENGILEFKSFLYEMFFGENNNKSKLAIVGFKQQMINICNEALSWIGENLLILGGSNYEFKQKLITLQDKEAALKNEQELINFTLKNELEKIDLNRLKSNFNANLKILAKSTNERVKNEIYYQKEQNSKRLSYIIQTALNDGIIDILRQNRNEIISQIELIGKNLMLKFDGFDELIQNQIFNVGEYLAKNDIKLDFSDITNKICSDSKNTLILLNDYLSSDFIRGLVTTLVSFEKEKFLERIFFIIGEKMEKFTRTKTELEANIKLVQDSNCDVLSEIKRFSSLKSELELIRIGLDNV